MLALPRELEMAGFGAGTDVLIGERRDGSVVLTPARSIERPRPTKKSRIAPTLVSLRRKGEEIRSIASRFGFDNIRIFGSVANGTARADSDVDLLVHLATPAKGWEYFGRLDQFRQAMEALLGRSVDVIDEHELNRDRMSERVLQEAIRL